MQYRKWQFDHVADSNWVQHRNDDTDGEWTCVVHSAAVTQPSDFLVNWWHHAPSRSWPLILAVHCQCWQTAGLAGLQTHCLMSTAYLQHSQAMALPFPTMQIAPKLTFIKINQSEICSARSLRTKNSHARLELDGYCPVPINPRPTQPSIPPGSVNE